MFKPQPRCWPLLPALLAKHLRQTRMEKHALLQHQSLHHNLAMCQQSNTSRVRRLGKQASTSCKVQSVVTDTTTASPLWAINPTATRKELIEAACSTQQRLLPCTTSWPNRRISIAAGCPKPHSLGNMYAGPWDSLAHTNGPSQSKQGCSLRLLRFWCLLLLLLLLLERLCLFHCEPLAPPAALCCLHVLQGRLINLLSTTAHGSTTVMPGSKECCQSLTNAKS